MFFKRYNSHFNIRMSCLLLCFLGVILLAISAGYVYLVANTELTNVSVRSEDNAIVVEYSAPSFLLCQGVEVAIKDGEDTVWNKELSPLSRRVSYTEGEYGKPYTVMVKPIYRDGRDAEAYEKKSVLYLEYEKLPDLPLMIINTKTGEDPTYDVAVKPDESLLGASQTNNEYVVGEMELREGESVFSTGIKIKTHGNTSVLASEKKPYKIVLDDGYDLLGQENNGSYKEWILLDTGYNLNAYIGNLASEICGMEWQMETGFVNVILNGDWKGCYCLMHAVCYESAEGLVSKSGYVFEYDAYWWKPDTTFFRTANQNMQYGFTFKYPRNMEAADSRITLLKQYMDTFEDYLLNGDQAYQEYIDEDSFVRWTLSRDITGIYDGCGANMYFYKYDFDVDDPTSSKVKMGPLWDFDSIFLQEGLEAWSSSRYSQYIPALFEQKTFYQEYVTIWKNISETLYERIAQGLSQLNGEALNASWNLEKNRWNRKVETFDKQYEDMLEQFSRRIIWINNELNLPALEQSAIDISEFYQYIDDSVAWCIDGQEEDENGKIIKGWAFLKDRIMTKDCQIGWKVADKVYCANFRTRGDVKKAYNLKTDRVGFQLCTQYDGEICIIDRKNKIVYGID